MPVKAYSAPDLGPTSRLYIRIHLKHDLDCGLQRNGDNKNLWAKVLTLLPSFSLARCCRLWLRRMPLVLNRGIRLSDRRHAPPPEWLGAKCFETLGRLDPM